MRDSTEAAIETGVSYAAIVFVGLSMMLGGGYASYLEIRGTTHSWHSIFFGCVALCGAVVILLGVGQKKGQTVFQTIAITVTPWIPKIGGGRPGDPPASAP